MIRTFSGSAIFLDRSDINTDEIIPARYLTEVTKDALKPYLLEDLTLDGFDPQGEVLQQAAVIVSRKNFGCGSSREHAPWALEVNGIYCWPSNCRRPISSNCLPCSSRVRWPSRLTWPSSA